MKSLKQLICSIKITSKLVFLKKIDKRISKTLFEKANRTKIVQEIEKRTERHFLNTQFEFIFGQMSEKERKNVLTSLDAHLIKNLPGGTCSCEKLRDSKKLNSEKSKYARPTRPVLNNPNPLVLIRIVTFLFESSPVLFLSTLNRLIAKESGKGLVFVLFRMLLVENSTTKQEKTKSNEILVKHSSDWLKCLHKALQQSKMIEVQRVYHFAVFSLLNLNETVDLEWIKHSCLNIEWLKMVDRVQTCESFQTCSNLNIKNISKTTLTQMVEKKDKIIGNLLKRANFTDLKSISKISWEANIQILLNTDRPLSIRIALQNLYQQLPVGTENDEFLKVFVENTGLKAFKAATETIMARFLGNDCLSEKECKDILECMALLLNENILEQINQKTLIAILNIKFDLEKTLFSHFQEKFSGFRFENLTEEQIELNIPKIYQKYVPVSLKSIKTIKNLQKIENENRLYLYRILPRTEKRTFLASILANTVELVEKIEENRQMKTQSANEKVEDIANHLDEIKNDDETDEEVRKHENYSTDKLKIEDFIDKMSKSGENDELEEKLRLHLQIIAKNLRKITNLEFLVPVLRVCVHSFPEETLLITKTYLKLFKKQISKRNRKKRFKNPLFQIDKRDILRIIHSLLIFYQNQSKRKYKMPENDLFSFISKIFRIYHEIRPVLIDLILSNNLLTQKMPHFLLNYQFLFTLIWEYERRDFFTKKRILSAFNVVILKLQQSKTFSKIFSNNLNNKINLNLEEFSYTNKERPIEKVNCSLNSSINSISDHIPTNESNYSINRQHPEKCSSKKHSIPTNSHHNDTFNSNIFSIVLNDADSSISHCKWCKVPLGFDSQCVCEKMFGKNKLRILKIIFKTLPNVLLTAITSNDQDLKTMCLKITSNLNWNIFTSNSNDIFGMVWPEIVESVVDFTGCCVFEDYRGIFFKIDEASGIYRNILIENGEKLFSSDSNAIFKQMCTNCHKFYLAKKTIRSVNLQLGSNYLLKYVIAGLEHPNLKVKMGYRRIMEWIIEGVTFKIEEFL